MDQRLSRRRFVVLSASMLSALGVSAACSSVPFMQPAPAAAPARPKTVRLMAGAEPDKLNAILDSKDGLDNVVYNVMEPLLDLPDETGRPVPRLATQWEHSTDFTSWRFSLRKGVKFHDGSDFTAQDVVDTAKWLIDEKATSFNFPRVPVKDAVVVDPHTVDFFSRPRSRSC